MSSIVADAASPPRALARRHVQRLAVLHGASPDAIVATISLWPLGTVLALAAHGIILHEDAAEIGGHFDSRQFELTQLGLQTIEACAAWSGVDGPSTVHAV